jgi:hypothetical protein
MVDKLDVMVINNNFRNQHKTNLDNMHQGADPKVNTDAKKSML